MKGEQIKILLINKAYFYNRGSKKKEKKGLECFLLVNQRNNIVLNVFDYMKCVYMGRHHIETIKGVETPPDNNNWIQVQIDE